MTTCPSEVLKSCRSYTKIFVEFLAIEMHFGLVARSKTSLKRYLVLARSVKQEHEEELEHLGNILL